MHTLLVLGLRYDCGEKNFTEEYLKGGEAVVAYNPESATLVYLLREGEFIEFHLIESRFSDKSFEEIREIQRGQKAIVGAASHDNLQGRIDLTSHVERIVSGAERGKDVNLRNIRRTKERAKRERHKDFMEEVDDSGESDDADAKDDDG